MSRHGFFVKRREVLKEATAGGKKMFFAGIDIGSTVTKIVIMDQHEQIRYSLIRPTGAEHRKLANRLMEEALRYLGISLEQIDGVVATGYGRINVPFADRRITEITCHTRGVSWHFPSARTIIDIGGQDSKGIRTTNGKVVSFVMNDKCAAGTGRFLDVLGDSLGRTPGELGEIALEARAPVEINSICTVFAEQEIASHLSRGAPMPEIAAGIYEAIASRVCGMAQRIGIEKEIVITGGVAKSKGLIKAIERILGKVLLPPEPFLTGAIGAALLAGDMVLASIKTGTPFDKASRRLEEATFFNELAR
jgi:predicted CoA-substrate-specific enzyme activase